MTNTIKISKQFTPDLWLGTEVSIPDESNEEQKIEAFQKEYITLVKAAQRLNPGISVNQKPEPYNQPSVIQLEKEEKQDIEWLIRNSTSLPELKSYQTLAKQKPELETVYLQMLETLSK